MSRGFTKRHKTCILNSKYNFITLNKMLVENNGFQLGRYMNAFKDKVMQYDLWVSRPTIPKQHLKI
jgi:hypothetical protein